MPISRLTFDSIADINWHSGAIDVVGFHATIYHTVGIFRQDNFSPISPVTSVDKILTSKVFPVHSGCGNLYHIIGEKKICRNNIHTIHEC